MAPQASNPIVHLELHTENLPRACGFYTQLFGWRAECVAVGSASYLALGLGNGIEGGVVERESDTALWLPYVQVDSVHAATERAQMLGGSVQLAPREGPAGWRSVIAAPSGGDFALWQRKN